MKVVNHKLKLILAMCVWWMLLKIIIIIIINWLVTHGYCIVRSWNLAANDNHLWELQYVALYSSAAKQQPMRLVEDRNNRLLQEPIGSRNITDWKEAVKGAYTGKPTVDILRSRKFDFTWLLFWHPILS